jgi:predicted RNase H-like nuclease (RuvC/YqgF family)
VSKYVRISKYKQIKEKAKKRQLIIESLKVKVAEQDKRIAELEKERDQLNGKFEEYFDAFMNCKCTPRNMEVHNLEQQEKGFEAAIYAALDLGLIENDTNVCNSIREQANKGGAE